MARISVTQTKSPVSLPKDQGQTLRALGLHRMRDTVEHNDSPSVMGMVHKVRHLVTVVKLEEQ